MCIRDRLTREITALRIENGSDLDDLSSVVFRTLSTEISDLSSDTSVEISVVQSLTSDEITDLSSYTSSELSREISEISSDTSAEISDLSSLTFLTLSLSLIHI